MPVGHLLAARKVQTHQGTETEEEGEIQHEEDILHGREGSQSPPAQLCVSGEPKAASLPPTSRPLGVLGESANPLPKHSLLCHTRLPADGLLWGPEDGALGRRTFIK